MACIFYRQLKTLALGNTNFSSEQIDLLTDISNRCPLSDGEAVLRARAMLTLVDGDVVSYDDEIFCGNIENRSNLGGEYTTTSGYVKIFPNPASDFCTIEFFQLGQKEGSIAIYNSVGLLVKEVKIEGERGQHSIDTSDLKEGTYWYYMTNNKARPISGKFSIQR